jgi:hypothetical protein
MTRAFDMPRLRVRSILKALVIVAFGLWPMTSIGADGSVTYRYDALGRLVAASYGNGLCVIYAYDKNGNRLTEVTGASSTAGVGFWGCFAWNQAQWGQ